MKPGIRYINILEEHIFISDNMKIRSITDVITNSSTEVWAIRSETFEKAKSLFRDKAWREKTFESGEKENLYDYFVSFPDFQSILDAWETPFGKNAIEHYIPRELRYLLYREGLKPGEIMILQKFGHTKEEMKAYVDKLNEERISKLMESQEDWEPYFGWSVAVFYDHFRMWGGSEPGKKLRDWLKTNCDQEDWWYEY